MLRLAFASGERPPLLAAGREVNAWRSDGGEVFARLFAGGSHRWVDWPGLGLFVFSEGTGRVDVWPDAPLPAAAVQDIFDRAILPAALQALGRQALHASGVVIDERALLICGRSGSGKSTIAFSLGCSGHRQIADDAVVLDLGAGVAALPLAFSPRLRAPSRAHFFGTQDSPAASVPEAVPLAAIVEVRQQADLTTPAAELVAPAAAFALVLAHAHCFDPGDRAESRRLTEDYARIAAEIPVWTVRYQPGLDRLRELEDVLIGIATRGRTIETGAR